MSVNSGVDTAIKVAILIFLVMVILIVAITWWNWFHDPTGFLPADPTDPSGDGLGGWIKDINDMLKKLLGG